MESHEVKVEGEDSKYTCRVAPRGWYICAILSFGVALFSIRQSHAATYHVNQNHPAASDNNSGLDSANPWKTIGKAAQTLEAGDKVIVHEGAYKEQVRPRNSGTESQPIEYVVAPGETVTIDGETVATIGKGLVYFQGTSSSPLGYIRFSGFRVVHSDSAGIHVADAEHIVIDTIYTYDTYSSGIFVWRSSNITVTNNEVVLACNDGEQECITMAETDTFEIGHNIVRDSGPGTNGGEGIDVKQGSRNGTVHHNHVHHINRLGIYVDSYGPTSNVDIYQNVVHNCDSDGIAVTSETSETVSNIKIYNNIVYDNASVGIDLPQWGPGRTENIMVVNNTVVHNGFEAGWGGGIRINNDTLLNVVIRNNICVYNRDFQIAIKSLPPGGDSSIDHNLVYSSSGRYDYDGETEGDNGQKGDPGFVAYTPGSKTSSPEDFMLLENSIAIDNGSSVGAPDEDFGGGARPAGPAVDIGAYEYGRSSGTRPIPPRNLRIIGNL